MSKSDETRAKILRASAKLLAEKGFVAVTMKDICEATGLSRGGLYRHFGSVAEILAELIGIEQRTAVESVSVMEEPGYSVAQGISDFIAFQREILVNNWYTGMEIAAMQYAVTSEEGRLINEKRIKDSSARIARLIRKGQEQGVCAQMDADAVAMHIIIILGGLRQQVSLNDFDVQFVDKQMDLIRNLMINGYQKE